MRSILKVNWDSNLPIYEISQSELQKKEIQCLLLDVDGTLLNRNSTRIPKAVKNWIRESEKLFTLYLISNNPSKKRIAKIAKEFKLRYKYNASKPRKKEILNVIKEVNFEAKNIAIIGDRIFTDIIGGNRCNIKTILVKRLKRNGLPTKFNLTLTIEKLISFFIK
ncbi:YqeG family HAD IIIA-type phosphatase [Prochlorococcus marinus str. MU1404]|uniref:YqeG family HAD IIIA-type phosphatase n=1 Tax=Prochlorococcus marinus TaxID=1219 RepID=UPI001ADC15AE|nr:YqeG family HAD IIIA-type phosphatase [Prochlorococcus marinus]MBO8230019.1 YqeG family HAD IIIA-type phosphatase [Prochlorococcus marinus XMU1404]MBW3073207.1 YqeG family HAD IIIA-type phosphatase [Prochlorococcus marinus str. MU1404]MCR8545644.1 YqeG family HAD IIIA-type phosphatase [Prochlorococcus marinus CUG1432]